MSTWRIPTGLRRLSKVLILLTAFAVLPLASVPAQATFTETGHFTHLVDSVPIGCGGVGSDLTFVDAIGNGVNHTTGNLTGFWFTTTFAGDGTMHFASAPAVVYTGHVAEWFGIEDQLKSFVVHATFNFDGTDPTGTTLHLHGAFDQTFNAAGTLTASHAFAFCH